MNTFVRPQNTLRLLVLAMKGNNIMSEVYCYNSNNMKKSRENFDELMTQSDITMSCCRFVLATDDGTKLADMFISSILYFGLNTGSDNEEHQCIQENSGKRENKLH